MLWKAMPQLIADAAAPGSKSDGPCGARLAPDETAPLTPRWRATGDR